MSGRGGANQRGGDKSKGRGRGGGGPKAKAPASAAKGAQTKAAPAPATKSEPAKDKLPKAKRRLQPTRGSPPPPRSGDDTPEPGEDDATPEPGEAPAQGEDSGAQAANDVSDAADGSAGPSEGGESGPANDGAKKEAPKPVAKRVISTGHTPRKGGATEETGPAAVAPSEESWPSLPPAHTHAVPPAPVPAAAAHAPAAAAKKTQNQKKREAKARKKAAKQSGQTSAESVTEGDGDGANAASEQAASTAPADEEIVAVPDDAARAEAQQSAAEAAAAEELAREQAANEEAERIAADAAEEEARRVAAEARAAEQAAADEAERVAAEQAAADKAEKAAAEKAAAREAAAEEERRVAREAAAAEKAAADLAAAAADAAQRAAAEEAAKVAREAAAAEKAAQEKAAAKEAERLAADQAAADETQRVAAAQAAADKKLVADLASPKGAAEERARELAAALEQQQAQQREERAQRAAGGETSGSLENSADGGDAQKIAEAAREKGRQKAQEAERAFEEKRQREQREKKEAAEKRAEEVEKARAAKAEKYLAEKARAAVEAQRTPSKDAATPANATTPSTPAPVPAPEAAPAHAPAPAALSPVNDATPAPTSPSAVSKAPPSPGPAAKAPPSPSAVAKAPPSPSAVAKAPPSPSAVAKAPLTPPSKTPASPTATTLSPPKPATPVPAASGGASTASSSPQQREAGGRSGGASSSTTTTTTTEGTAGNTVSESRSPFSGSEPTLPPAPEDAKRSEEERQRELAEMRESAKRGDAEGGAEDTIQTAIRRTRRLSDSRKQMEKFVVESTAPSLNVPGQESPESRQAREAREQRLAKEEAYRKANQEASRVAKEEAEKARIAAAAAADREEKERRARAAYALALAKEDDATTDDGWRSRGEPDRDAEGRSEAAERQIKEAARSVRQEVRRGETADAAKALRDVENDKRIREEIQRRAAAESDRLAKEVAKEVEDMSQPSVASKAKLETSQPSLANTSQPSLANSQVSLESSRASFDSRAELSRTEVAHDGSSPSKKDKSKQNSQSIKVVESNAGGMVRRAMEKARGAPDVTPRQRVGRPSEELFHMEPSPLANALLEFTSTVASPGLTGETGGQGDEEARRRKAEEDRKRRVAEAEKRFEAMTFHQTTLSKTPASTESSRNATPELTTAPSTAARRLSPLPELKPQRLPETNTATGPAPDERRKEIEAKMEEMKRSVEVMHNIRTNVAGVTAAAPRFTPPVATATGSRKRGTKYSPPPSANQSESSPAKAHGGDFSGESGLQEDTASRADDDVTNKARKAEELAREKRRESNERSRQRQDEIRKKLDSATPNKQKASGSTSPVASSPVASSPSPAAPAPATSLRDPEVIERKLQHLRSEVDKMHAEAAQRRRGSEGGSPAPERPPMLQSPPAGTPPPLFSPHSKIKQRVSTPRAPRLTSPPTSESEGDDFMDWKRRRGRRMTPRRPGGSAAQGAGLLGRISVLKSEITETRIALEASPTSTVAARRQSARNDTQDTHQRLLANTTNESEESHPLESDTEAWNTEKDNEVRASLQRLKHELDSLNAVVTQALGVSRPDDERILTPRDSNLVGDSDTDDGGIAWDVRGSPSFARAASRRAARSGDSRTKDAPFKQRHSVSGSPHFDEFANFVGEDFSDENTGTARYHTLQNPGDIFRQSPQPPPQRYHPPTTTTAAAGVLAWLPPSAPQAVRTHYAASAAASRYVRRGFGLAHSMPLPRTAYVPPVPTRAYPPGTVRPPAVWPSPVGVPRDPSMSPQRKVTVTYSTSPTRQQAPPSPTDYRTPPDYRIALQESTPAIQTVVYAPAPPAGYYSAPRPGRHSLGRRGPFG